MTHNDRRAICVFFRVMTLVVTACIADSSLVMGQDRSTEAEKKAIREIKLWPNGLPGDAFPLEEKRIRELKKKQTPNGHIYYVDSPTISAFLPDRGRSNGCAVVICPGGGYNVLAWEHEGVEIANWFNSIGVSAFILKYRVPRRNPEKIYWEPLQDIQRAIRLVRHRAEHFKIDPNRIGTLGFSAGGHLTVLAGLQSATETYPAFDEVDKVSCRPDFICPIYAAYLGEGEKDNSPNLGPLVQVRKDSPPTFMAATWDDTFRGAQAAMLFVELKKNGVPAELHAWAKGGHGYGIRKSDNPVSQWHHQLELWLKASQFN